MSQPLLQRGDIVRFTHFGTGHRGTYIGIRTKKDSTVAVRGGPPCDVPTKDIQLVARPIADGFRVYLDGVEIGVVDSAADINPLRAKNRKSS